MLLATVTHAKGWKLITAKLSSPRSDCTNGAGYHLQVETRQSALFAHQKAVWIFMTRHMNSSVPLVEALGGGSESDKPSKN
jgi:hypothetical protein